MPARFARFLPVLTVVLPTVSAGAQTVTFEKIRDALSAADMSPDGRFIVGASDLDGNLVPDGTYLLDTQSGVMTILPPLGLTAVAVSDDGTVVLGDIPDPEGIGSNVAAIWTEAMGWQSLGHLPNAGACPSRSDGYELSADGSAAVGLSWDGCSGRGFLWTAETDMLELEPLANGGNRASVVSADGMLIGGFAQGTFSRTPAIWDGATLAGTLLGPGGPDAQGEVRGISDDGTVLLGTLWLGELYYEAVKWTQGPSGWEPEKLGEGSILPGWAGNGMDIADNGTIVGFDTLMTSRRAWIQPRGTGPLFEIGSWIESHGGMVPDGYPLEVCQAITTDGRIIIGHGFQGAWRVLIDWPCVATATTSWTSRTSSSCWPTGAPTAPARTSPSPSTRWALPTSWGCWPRGARVRDRAHTPALTVFRKGTMT
ncbi:MAG: hypothetical protein ACYTGT_17440 [Planctomycetota bacterium]